MYIRFENGLVSEIVPDIDPTFPNVPIEERFPAEFIAELKYCADDTEVEVGMMYYEETDSFDYPPPPPAADFVPDLEPYGNTGNAGDITQAEINLDFEYRLSCLELGIN